MEVSDKDLLLQGFNVQLEELEPDLFESDLVHVDVSRWDRFVTSLKTFIAVSAVGPFAKGFNDFAKVIAELFRAN